MEAPPAQTVPHHTYGDGDDTVSVLLVYPSIPHAIRTGVLPIGGGAVTTWRDELTALDCHVGDFIICQYRKPGQWIAINLIVGYELPEQFHSLPAMVGAQWLMPIRKPVQVMALFNHSLPGHQRVSGSIIDLHKRSGDLIRVEMMPKRIWFYLRAPKDCGTSREELEGQEPIGWRIIPRIVAQSHRKVVAQ